MNGTWTILVAAVVTAVVALILGKLLRRRGLLRLEPVRYVPHLVFLCTLAAGPMLARGGATGMRVASVFAAVAAIWIVALMLLSRMRA
jgi:hypothetical protein